ncbi:constitutive coactivator of peroxisome proliferator-activated receptor gamma-like [Rhodnius prolixus]|uniref:constitutive coactivator of peroxisome proliferator-activated receptor gamma-like n=1 Tax=Rhodnius prolixus TaxID=13249 RepID=UPI003D18943D
MGIRGLETYLERNSKGACYKVDIKEIILSYRQKNGKNPKIVIDGMSALSHLYNKNLPWISGGQLKEFYEVIREFITAFISLGAELISFFDGPPVPSKRSTWVKRRLDTLEDIYALFDDLAAGVDPLQIQSHRKNILSPNAGCVIMYVFHIFGCKVYKSVLECDAEISKFALENDCLAILAQDSDFIIYEGAEYYWSMKNFDLDTMTTLNYDRIKLANSLRIPPQHLPLVASLMGNDVVPYDLVMPFKRVLLRRNNVDFSACIERISDYVRRLPVGPAIYNYLPQIAKEVFCDESKTGLLYESLLSYDLHRENLETCKTGNDHWDTVLELVKEQYIYGSSPSNTFGIVHQQRYWASTGLEDFRVNDLPPAQLILRKLRQHIYGILLHEKPLAVNQIFHEVKELVMSGPTSLDSDVNVNAIPVQVEHPGLKVLWNEKDRSIDNIRWTLVGEAVQVNPTLIYRLPAHLIVPSIALSYLLKQGLVVSKWEIDAVLSSAIVLRELSPDNLKSLPVKIPDSRSIRLQTIFTRTYSAIIMLLSVCGNPLPFDSIVPTNYQDGKLFLSKYSDAKNGCSISKLCDYKVNHIETFNLITDFISAAR